MAKEGDTMTDEEYRKAAREQYQRDGEIEIDSNAQVSINVERQEGAYVQAWVWVADPEQEVPVEARDGQQAMG